MTQAQAISILSNHYNATYGGTFVSALTDNLIENIMWENDLGKTYHRFGDTIVEDSNLIPLANYYQNN